MIASQLQWHGRLPWNNQTFLGLTLPPRNHRLWVTLLKCHLLCGHHTGGCTKINCQWMNRMKCLAKMWPHKTGTCQHPLWSFPRHTPGMNHTFPAGAHFVTFAGSSLPFKHSLDLAKKPICLAGGSREIEPLALCFVPWGS